MPLPFLKMRMLEPRFSLPDAWPQDRAPVLSWLLYGTSPEAFAVDERGAPPPVAADGAHHWALWVEKRGLSTAAVASALARWAGCAPGAVGFAGQKDRYAVTGQWFTVPRGVADPEPSLPEGEGWRALKLYPAAKKWRRGDHTGNGFRLRLAGAPYGGAALEAVLPAVQARLAAPIANYFGPQRFGVGAGNLDAVQRWLAAGSLPRHGSRSFLFSAARAYLFNRLLANLYQAVQVACSADARGRGVMVVMDGQIHSARDVAKRATQGVGAFHSATRGPLGWVDDFGVHLSGVERSASVPFAGLSLPTIWPQVVILHGCVQPSAALIPALLSAGVEGLVFTGTGAGQLSAVERNALAQWKGPRPLMLRANRCGMGPVHRCD